VVTKHFFKILVIFIVMILLGIAGVLWSSSGDGGKSLLSVFGVKNKNETVQIKK